MTHPDFSSIQDLAALLESRRFPVGAEKPLQAEIEAALLILPLAYEREVRLSSEDIIDFLVSGIGIEVKVKGSPRDILRQMKRYAAHDRVKGLILVTAKAMGMPTQIGGKPVEVVSLGRAWL